MEVREGREDVDPVMGGQRGTGRSWTLLWRVRGGQEGCRPCYGGSESGSEDVYPIKGGLSAAARRWTMS